MSRCPSIVVLYRHTYRITIVEKAMKYVHMYYRMANFMLRFLCTKMVDKALMSSREQEEQVLEGEVR